MREAVTVQIQRVLFDGFRSIASGGAISVGDLIGRRVKDKAQVQSSPKNPSKVQALPQLIPVFAAARSWADLDTALGARGYVLRPHGSGVAICRAGGGRFLCTTDALGHRYRNLVRRFGDTMPGHPFGLDWVSDAARERGHSAQDLKTIETGR